MAHMHILDILHSTKAIGSRRAFEETAPVPSPRVPHEPDGLMRASMSFMHSSATSTLHDTTGTLRHLHHFDITFEGLPRGKPHAAPGAGVAQRRPSGLRWKFLQPNAFELRLVFPNSGRSTLSDTLPRLSRQPPLLFPSFSPPFHISHRSLGPPGPLQVVDLPTRLTLVASLFHLLEVFASLKARGLGATTSRSARRRSSELIHH